MNYKAQMQKGGLVSTFIVISVLNGFLELNVFTFLSFALAYTIAGQRWFNYFSFGVYLVLF